MSSPFQNIPTPSDSYDHAHTTQATITSLRSLAASFDATFLSLNETIQSQTDRLEAIAQRAERCQKKLDSTVHMSKGKKVHTTGEFEKKAKDKTNITNSDDGAIVNLNVSIPSLYEEAVGIQNLALELKQQSALSKAREDSNAAVLAVLQREAMQSESELESVSEDSRSKGTNTELHKNITTARPSDDWLDRASAFEERRVCKTAIKMDSIPPLMVDTYNSIRQTQNTNLSGRSDCTETNDGKNDTSHSVNELIEKQEALYYKHGLDRIRQEQEQQQQNMLSPTSASTIEASGSGPANMNINPTSRNKKNGWTFTNNDDDMSSPFSIHGNASHASHYNDNDDGSILSHASATHRRMYRKRMLAAKTAASLSRPPFPSSSSSSVASSVYSSSFVNNSNEQRETSSASSILYHGTPPRSNTSVSGVVSTSTPLSSSRQQTTNSSSSGTRQQSMTGSLPYLCEILHDTYGLGGSSSAGNTNGSNNSSGRFGGVGGDSGNVFKTVTDVCDLTLFGTQEMVYSPTVSSLNNPDQSKRNSPSITRRANEYEQSKSMESNVHTSESESEEDKEVRNNFDKSLPKSYSYVPDRAQNAGLFQLPETLPFET